MESADGAPADQSGGLSTTENHDTSENSARRTHGWRGPMAVVALFGLSIAGYALIFAAIDSVTKNSLHGVF